MRGLRAADIRIEQFLRGGPLEARLVTDRSFARLEYVFLVHGWNIQSGHAVDEYDVLIEEIGQRSNSTVDSIFTVTWPTVRSYHESVVLARDAGTALANLLLARDLLSGAASITLVGHSLGCRVILEALDALKNASNLSRRSGLTALLMAAAVPVDMVLPSGRLFVPTTFADRANVYYSPSDIVLRSLFGFGQTRAPTEEGILPEAVGLRGRPREGIWDVRKRMSGFQHGSYWRRAEMFDEICNVIIRDQRYLPGLESVVRYLPERLLDRT
ncbi:MAG: alpha/beta fold hydrolase [Hyphomonadaceae bacterium]